MLNKSAPKLRSREGMSKSSGKSFTIRVIREIRGPFLLHNPVAPTPTLNAPNMIALRRSGTKESGGPFDPPLPFGRGRNRPRKTTPPSDLLAPVARREILGKQTASQEEERADQGGNSSDQSEAVDREGVGICFHCGLWVCFC